MLSSEPSTMPQVLGTSKSIHGFDPRSVPGCTLWLDAADSSVTGGGATVTTWKDKSSNGFSYTGNATLSNFGTPGTSIYSDGTKWLSSNAGATSVISPPYSVFTVGYETSDGVRRIVNGISNASFDGSLFIGAWSGNVGTAFVGNGVSWNAFYTPYAPVLSNWTVTAITVSNTASTSVVAGYVNGVTQTTQTGSILAAPLSGLNILGGYGSISNSGNQIWVGYVGEVIVFNSVLTTAERQAVEGYLAWKWRPTPITAPTSIPGCVLWLDAADASRITLAGGTSNVTAWTDKSASPVAVTITNGSVSNTYVNTTSAQYPGPCILTSSNSYITAAVDIRRAGTYSNAHLFILYQYTPWTSGTGSVGVQSILFGNGDLIQALNQSIVGAEYQSGVLNDGFGTIGNYQNVVDRKRKLYEYTTISNTATSNLTYVWLNGVQQPTFFSRRGTNNGTPSVTTTFAGYSNVAGGGQNIGFHEIIVFSNTLSDYNRYQVEYYLSNKWSPLVKSQIGICVPSTPLLGLSHPFALVRPFSRYFNPTDISGCQLWLDAADPSSVTGTTTVTAWRDKSGNGRNFGVGSGTTSYANSAVTFSNSYMFVSNAVNLTAFTFFIVAKTNVASNNQIVFGARPNASLVYNSTDGFGFYMDGVLPSSTRFYGQTTSGAQVSTNAVTTSSPNIFAYTSGSTVINAWINGTSGFGASSLSTRTGTAQGFAIGGEWGGSSYNYVNIAASIYEIIVYNASLTAAQRQEIEGYLSWKWSIGLNVITPTHPFYTFPPSSVVPFLPTDITGCQLWIDASRDGTSNTGYISEIPDYSAIGSGSAHLQPIVPGQSGQYTFYTTGGTAPFNAGTGGPLYTNSNQIQLCNSFLNGLSVYSFSNNMAAGYGSTQWGTSFTQFAVVKTAVGRWRCSYTFGTTLADIDTKQSNANGYVMNIGGFQAKDTGVATNVSVFTGRGNGTTGWNLFVIGYAAGCNVAANYSINGTSYSATTTGSTSPQFSTIAAGGNFVLNGNFNGTTYVSADTTFLAELIHYNGNISAQDRRIVEGYLMNKWGI